MLAFKLDLAIGAFHRLINIIMQTQTKFKIQRIFNDESKVSIS